MAESPQAAHWQGPIRDEGFAPVIVDSHVGFVGRKWSIVSDTIEFNGQSVVRDVMRHPGAVAVLPMDDQERVLLIRQYRHPVGAYLWEIPAGLLDLPGEDPRECARRELVEEAGLEADRLDHVLTLALTPGGSDERIHIYLATGIREVPRTHTGEAEEADIATVWVPLTEAVDLCLAGAIANATAVSAILAAWARRNSRP